MTLMFYGMTIMVADYVIVLVAVGCTVCTDDGLPSAQWENMILITETGNEILTY